ncbi:unnamed protein product [Cyclocybe aegerita]|uniref:Uncharacterized protein n=1 Tax=Cyclocybe aegerita TaxID=1973307 RepID=A0A8S0VYF6_CYCAE|nr:unnamed protein product [Cyclocybe aegerita]
MQIVIAIPTKLLPASSLDTSLKAHQLLVAVESTISSGLHIAPLAARHTSAIVVIHPGILVPAIVFALKLFILMIPSPHFIATLPLLFGLPLTTPQPVLLGPLLLMKRVFLVMTPTLMLRI